MNVKDLIEKLKQFDENLTVVVGGFDEFGYADINRVKPVKIAQVKDPENDPIGEYRRPDELKGCQVIDAIHIDH